jgi:histone H3/H4
MESADSTNITTEPVVMESANPCVVPTVEISEQDDIDDKEVVNSKIKKSNKRKDDSNNVCLPRASVKRIMKLPENVGNITGEAAAVVGKATELFLEKIVLASSTHTQSCKKKQIKLENIAAVIYADQKKYEFLNNAFGPLKKL